MTTSTLNGLNTPAAANGSGGHDVTPPPPSFDRVLAAVRLQLLAWPSSVILSWTILAMSFVINLVLWSALGETALAEAWTGGLGSIYFLVVGVYVTAMTQIFPLAVGFGLTRRAFYVGMAVLAIAHAVVYGTIFELLGMVEAATDGWGADLGFFRPRPLDEMSSPARLATYIVPFLILAHIGICLGVTHRRWGSTGIYAVLAGTLAVVAAAVATITLGGWWGGIGRWLGDQSVAELAALWTLPFLAALVVSGWAGIQRTVP